MIRPKQNIFKRLYHSMIYHNNKVRWFFEDNFHVTMILFGLNLFVLNLFVAFLLWSALR